MNHILGFDVGGTKVAWGSFTTEGAFVKAGRFSTPETLDAFVKTVAEIAKDHNSLAIGIGIAGTVNPERTGTRVCTNIPQLSDAELAAPIQKLIDIPVIVDNDARCALIGEVWKGAASDLSSCVLVTVGTGIGGGVMQKGSVLPHPDDLSREVGRIVVDPTDVFPAHAGSGTVEAFIGGRNLEERLQIDLRVQAELVRKGDEEAIGVWHAVSYFFIQCMRAIHMQYSCKTIIIGGVGSGDLQYYLQDEPPCPIIAAKLGGDAGFYGAARLAIDEREAVLTPADAWE